MLTTLDSVKTFLGITGTTDDDLLNSLIGSASEFVKSYTWRDLEATDYTHFFDWKAEREFILRQYPVNTLTSFEYNTWTISTPERTEFDVDLYALRPDPGIINYWCYIPRGFQNIKVIYNAWYVTIPAELELATNKMVWLYYNTRTSTWVKSESVDGASITYDNNSVGIPLDINVILNKYKNV